ncbi:probable glutamate carboxypeptidase AMP1 isoform X1 [Magnolia sinica]|uniref:probable glutamate carboxypeptidase AMP1 isoform X1 n=1 Tax=Magnolia sinica TaxID=86752 RepID=UPI00265A2A4E|nr:probable glutamate carboxypeptidase AMP1 isoform X1 [Magnolia sinica]
MAQTLSLTLSKPTASILTTRPSLPYTLLFLILLCLAGYYTFHRHHSHPSPSPSQYNSQNARLFQALFLNASSNATISSFLHSLTLHPHLAGTPPALKSVQYVRGQLQASGLKTHVTEYKALLSYPARASLSAHFSNGSSADLFLREVGQSGPIVAPYHAYSPSGSVFARAVFVNYGREEDYRELGALGVSVSGCVAVARRGSISRGGVVERAEKEGAVALLLYAEGVGIERGTVMRGSGDPLTPGWAAVEGGEILGLEDVEVLKRFPKIPSMPISTENARMILGSLGGPQVPDGWRDTLLDKGIRVGEGPTFLNLTYKEEKNIATVQNVLAVIRGWEEPDRYILLGNHRDAWTYGAVDPNSGTAALLDIARRFGLLLRSGWHPRRTIVLCNWDAEEFGMIGSTEWVEQNLENLASKAVAYLNVDCAVQGPGFFASATPQLDNLLVEVTKQIKDPDSEGMTVYQTWVAANRNINVGRLSGMDSDFAAFVQHAGIASVDLYYGKDFPVYHTAFDSYDWMKKNGDPLFHRHVAVAGIWGLLALRLADDPILPFDYHSYAAQLQEHTKALSVLLDSDISLRPIKASIQELVAAANGIQELKKLGEQESMENPLELWRRALNDRLMLAERGFLGADGLKGRRWFKHLVYGPPNDHESKLSFFPGIADAISRGAKITKTERQSDVQHEIWRVARAIQRAAMVLRGELT